MRPQRGTAFLKKKNRFVNLLQLKGDCTVPLVELSLLVAGPRTSGHLSVAGNKLKMPKEKNADNCTVHKTRILFSNIKAE